MMCTKFITFGMCFTKLLVPVKGVIDDDGYARLEIGSVVKVRPPMADHYYLAEVNGKSNDLIGVTIIDTGKIVEKFQDWTGILHRKKQNRCGADVILFRRRKGTDLVNYNEDDPLLERKIVWDRRRENAMAIEGFPPLDSDFYVETHHGQRPRSQCVKKLERVYDKCLPGYIEFEWDFANFRLYDEDEHKRTHPGFYHGQDNVSEDHPEDTYDEDHLDTPTEEDDEGQTSQGSEDDYNPPARRRERYTTIDYGRRRLAHEPAITLGPRRLVMGRRRRLAQLKQRRDRLERLEALYA